MSWRRILRESGYMLADAVDLTLQICHATVVHRAQRPWWPTDAADRLCAAEEAIDTWEPAKP
jgi:hypothetical protein